jgi:glutamate-ammonia-ligase adenylyltransferase
VLAQGAANSSLVANVGNIALLERAQAACLLPAPLGEAAASAYRSLRQIQHRARLNEEPTQLPASEVAVQRAAGLALWTSVFGA